VNQKDANKYVSFLIKEMALRRREANGEPIKTVYFGGGTPSVLQISQLQQIIDFTKKYFSFEENTEMTIEANPEQLTADYCRNLKALGFNRISIGIQSFHDEILQFLGRKHSANEALQAVENAHSAGFDNISIDLIYGVNERNNEIWKKELETAFSLPIKHFPPTRLPWRRTRCSTAAFNNTGMWSPTRTWLPYNMLYCRRWWTSRRSRSTRSPISE
jgi:oxygen-independent coproporphyrinogen-3 oxidase